MGSASSAIVLKSSGHLRSLTFESEGPATILAGVPSGWPIHWSEVVTLTLYRRERIYSQSPFRGLWRTAMEQLNMRVLPVSVPYCSLESNMDDCPTELRASDALEYEVGGPFHSSLAATSTMARVAHPGSDLNFLLEDGQAPGTMILRISCLTRFNYAGFRCCIFASDH